MRIDHHAYQRATKVAGFGFLLQALIGVGLLIFALSSHDTAFRYASFYALCGVLVWLGLIIVFHQHKLERLEALEEDELASTRQGNASVFERVAEETRVAARRLEQMHSWMMPALSLLLAAALGGLAWWMLGELNQLGDAPPGRTSERGWAVAICLAIAVVSFIFSRFVAGMAKQQAWQNLRGGAAYMVGNALVVVAVAVGLIFRFFERDNQASAVINWITWAIPIFMIVVGAEIVLNFILNLYRPRVPGEIPRPAFDSKILSLLATPDSIVRSLNEAVNYQFGFDVTSSWGYQLLLRSFAWLVALGALVMVLLSMMVVIEPHQQAIKLRFGKVVGEPGHEVHHSGLMWKLPWPIETAEVHEVTRIRRLYLTPKINFGSHIPVEMRTVRWDLTDAPPLEGGRMDPFIVASPNATREFIDRSSSMEPHDREIDDAISRATLTREQQAEEVISSSYALVDAEIVLQYCIKDDGLLEYLSFAPETLGRRQTLSDRERLLRAIALGEVSAYFTRLSLDVALSPGSAEFTRELERRIQRAFDNRNTGVHVVSLTIPTLMPVVGAGPSFEELNVSMQASRQKIAEVEGLVFRSHTHTVGDASLVDVVLEELEKYDQLRAEQGTNAAETIEQRQRVEALLARGGGDAAQQIADAETKRWINLMSRHAESLRVSSQAEAYRAAPELYRQREQMRVYKNLMPLVRKYVIAIDPARVNIDADLKDISPGLDFAGGEEEEMKKIKTP